MKFKAPLKIGLLIASLSTSQLFAASSSYDTSYWTDNDGGLFNTPAVEYNPQYHGYGSTGLVVYNKIDLQDGDPMRIGEDSVLYDNQGNKIGTARDSIIGYFDGTRDGGIIAGAISRMRIDNQIRRVVYVWSVNVKEGGRKSGWTVLPNVTPTRKIKGILNSTKRARLNIILDEILKGDYVARTVRGAYLPSEAAEWYVTANRSASKSAGKAKYYFTREGLISGIINIPETGRQRYGVAHDVAPIGAVFYMDQRVPKQSLDIFPPSSSKPSGHKLELVWGYFKNNAGRRIYSWVNAMAVK